MTQDKTTPDPWVIVQTVEREIRMCAYTSAGDRARLDDAKMFAVWAGRLQLAIANGATS
jgi:hypothetical protein